jgi:hypothetical protein
MAPKHKPRTLIGSMSFSPQLCALCGRDRLSFAAKDRRGRRGRTGTEPYSKASR